MRDPERIPVLLQALEEFWMRDPDFRLGQIIVAATNRSGRRAISPEIFYLEDEDMLKGLKAMIESGAETESAGDP